MSKLKILACEDHAEAFKIVTREAGFKDVLIIEYPSICKNRKNIEKTRALVASLTQNSSEVVVIASAFCEILKMLPEEPALKIVKNNHCFSHLANGGLANYVISKGGYIVSNRWLKNWPGRLKEQGFDQETARSFYKSFAKELVLFGLSKKGEEEARLEELAAFLGLPYSIIPADLDKTRHLAGSIFYEWQLKKQLQAHGQASAELKAQCAEYAAILDFLAKISSFTNKRDTIEKVKEIFTTVLGARHFAYHADSSQAEEKAGFSHEECSENSNYCLFKDENRFSLKIVHGAKHYGFITVGDFLFPQYTEKYLNLAIEIALICGLVLSNIEHYERLELAKENYRQLSYRDSLTGLYNRTYLNNAKFKTATYTVFSFDIDNLKEVNDGHGHGEGDKLITRAADIIKNSFRDTDTIIRMGGDEFIAIVAGGETARIAAITGRIKKEIEEANAKPHQALYEISISMGHATADTGQSTLEELINEADRMMYAEKRRKKSREQRAEKHEKN